MVQGHNIIQISTLKSHVLSTEKYITFKNFYELGFMKILRSFWGTMYKISGGQFPNLQERMYQLSTKLYNFLRKFQKKRLCFKSSEALGISSKKLEKNLSLWVVFVLCALNSILVTVEAIWNEIHLKPMKQKWTLAVNGKKKYSSVHSTEVPSLGTTYWKFNSYFWYFVIMKLSTDTVLIPLYHFYLL